MGRIHLLTRAALGAAFALCACSNDNVDDYGGVLDLSGVSMGAYAQNVSPQLGYVADHPVEYYDFGVVTTTTTSGSMAVATTTPMYWFFDSDGKRLFALQQDMSGATARDANLLASLQAPPHPCVDAVENLPDNVPCDGSLVQHPLADTIPGKTDYTGFWQIFKVPVPKGYALDSIKSVATLKASALWNGIVPTDAVLNCPVLNSTASIVPGIAVRNRMYVQLNFWFRRQLATCVLTEGGDQDPLRLFAPSAVQALAPPAVHDTMSSPPMYGVISHNAYVPTYTLPTGKTDPVPGNLIAQALPNGAGGTYSPLLEFWEADVSASYTPGDAKSPDELTAMPIGAMPAETGEFHNISIRGEIPSCMSNAECDASQGLKCHMSAHLCAFGCQADADCASAYTGTTCGAMSQVCGGE